jgi:hypothetical protein
MRRPARRPRLGLGIAWFVAFWAAGSRPQLALLLAAWTVYWALSERLGLEWAVFGVALTAFCAVVAVVTYA